MPDGNPRAARKSRERDLNRKESEMSIRRGYKRSLAAVLIAGTLCTSGMTTEALAGAHKWETAPEEYGPGIIMSREQEQEYEEKYIPVTEEGQVIDTFNEVQALCRPGGREDYDQTYNCVVLVERYYRQVYGIKVSNEWQFEIPIADGVTSFTVTETPEPGDIGYETSSDGSPHWFIVKKVNRDGSFTVFEQNWKWVSEGVTYTAVNRRVSFEKSRDLRFFRRPGA